MNFILILSCGFISLANFASAASKCNDGFLDVHNMITDLYEQLNLIETQVRVQYNNFHAERLNSISAQIAFLKTLQNGFNQETCKYQGIEEGHGIYTALNEYINVVRRNVLYSIKASVDELRSDSLNLIYNYHVYHVDFVERIAQLSKNMFHDGKVCVLAMEKDVNTFLDMTVRKLMESMRAALQTNPLTVVSVRTLNGQLRNTFNQVSHYSRAYFGGIQQASQRIHNETAANNFNNYMRGIFPTVFDIGNKIAQVGLDTVEAIEAHGKAMRANIISMNSTYLTPKRVELLGRMENVCTGM